MTYTISVTNGDTISIESGEVNNSTSLTLIGRNVPNYGQTLNQNLVNMMQNFAGTETPSGPVVGQLWYDTNVGAIKFYTGTTFKNITSLTASTSQPIASVVGDLWWDQAHSTLKLWNGGTWVAIGPYTASITSATVADTIVDSDNVSRDVIKVVIGGTTVALISKVAFVPKVTFTGFPEVKVGFTLADGAFSAANKFTGNVAANDAVIETLSATTLAAGTITSDSIEAADIGNVSTAFVGSSLSVDTMTATTGYQGSTNGAHNGTVGATTPNTGAFTTLTATTGYQGSVNGAVNGTVGATTPNTGAFTTLTATILTATTGYNGAASGPFNGTVGATTPNTGAFTTLTATGNVAVGNLIASGGQVQGYLTGAIGANVANTGTFTTLTATSTAGITGNATVGNLQATGIGGQVQGYLTGAIGANVANTGTFTTLTASSASIAGNVAVGNLIANGAGGQVQGYLTGAIGANVANTGVFTSMTSNSLSVIGSDLSTTLVTITGSSGTRANIISTGSATIFAPWVQFSRTTTSTTSLSGGLWWLKTLTDGSVAQSFIDVRGTNDASAPSTKMYFTSPNGFSFVGSAGSASTLDVSSGILTAGGTNIVTANASAIGQIPFSTDGTSFVATQKITQATAVTTTTTSFTGATVGANTALTASSVTGTIQIGQVIGGTGLAAGTVITAGSGSSWTISPASTGTVSGTVTVRGVDFMNIPSWAKRITVMFNGVSTNGSSIVLIRFGTSSGIVSTGYASSAGQIDSAGGVGATTVTNGFCIAAGGTTNSLVGPYTFVNVSGNVWVGSFSMLYLSNTYQSFGSGSISLGGPLTTVRITTVNGTDTFDAGSVNILYE